MRATACCLLLSALAALAGAATLRGTRSKPDAALVIMSTHAQEAAESAVRRAFFAIVDPAINALLEGSAPNGAMADVVRRGAAVLDARSVGARLAQSMPGDLADVVRSLPNLIAQNLNASAVQAQDPTKLDPKAVQKAIDRLNSMIDEAQVRFDRKDIECTEFKEKSDETQRQVKSDLARLAETLSDLKEDEINSVNKIGQTTEAIELQKEETKTATAAYNKQLEADRAELAIHKADLKVTEFMLGLSKCPDAAFAQVAAASTEFEVCQDSNGSTTLTFSDQRLESSRASLSPRSRELLDFALGRAQVLGSNAGEGAALHAAALAYGTDFDLEDGDDGDEESMPRFRGESLAEVHQKPVQSGTSSATGAATDVVAEKKQGKRCTGKKPDCGVLHDTMAELWGQMKDAVEDLSKKMADRKANYTYLNKSFNAELDSLKMEKTTMGKNLAKTQATNAAETEVQSQKQTEQEDLVETHAKTMKECKATLRDILYNEICGTISVRNELIGATLKIKDAEIVDCSVTDWQPGECPMECDDNEIGGVMTITRDVITDKENHGSNCPALNMTKRCGRHKCPVDCKLSAWSGYSKCTKECGGGVQTRTRKLEIKPKNGGTHCSDLQETRSCNEDACDRNCKLSDWTPFTECSQACNAGFTMRSKSVILPERGIGKCFGTTDKERLERHTCNEQPCTGDEVCVAKRDVLIAIDGSGSITEKGFDVLKEFAITIIRRLKSEAYGQEAVNVAVVQFGNGHLDKGRVSDAILVEGLTSDMEGLVKKIEGLKIKKGFTNTAQAFMKASAILKRTMRRTAQGTALFITDGKPSFKSSTWTAVTKLKEASTVMIAHVSSFAKKKYVMLMKSYASQPIEANYIFIPGKKELKKNYDSFATDVIAKMCPGAESPSAIGKLVQQQGFAMVKAHVTCAGEQEPMKREAYTPGGCVDGVEMQWAMFAYKPAPPPAAGSCLLYMEPCGDTKEDTGYMLYEAQLPMF